MSPIEFKSGDLLAEPAEALVNPVNCEGFMGRGLAKQFKEAWPDNFRAYAAACAANDLRPGRVHVFETGRMFPPRYIVNFPTKRRWRERSRLAYVVEGLASLVEEIRRRAIRSVAIPPLGAGLGGLSWPEVRDLIVRAVAELPDVAVLVFQPRPDLERDDDHLPEDDRPTGLTPAKAALVSLMTRYVRGGLDHEITLLEVHKLAYFLDAAGESLFLRWAKGPYGPYAENLRHVLDAMEPTWVRRGRARGGRDGAGAPGSDEGARGAPGGTDTPGTPLHLQAGAAREAERVLASADATRARIEQVARLVEGFESPEGLELLATVHWVASRDGARDEASWVASTHAWGERKRRFDAEQIALAGRCLAEQGFLSASGPALTA